MTILFCKCDRCGKEFHLEKKSEMRKVRVYDGAKVVKVYDVCDTCFDEMMNHFYKGDQTCHMKNTRTDTV